jgi:hypothetical protein
MSPPPHGGTTPGTMPAGGPIEVDMRRTWKVDWSMHRQNHSLLNGTDGSR